MIAQLQDLLAWGVHGSRISARVDFNVPLEDGKVVDDARIRASLPTMKALSKAGARTMLLSHLGRPDGRSDPRLSLRATLPALRRILKEGMGDAAPEARFYSGGAGSPLRAQVAKVKPGDFLLLENTRFDPGERMGDRTLAEGWALAADHYVLDAFGSAHRAHASTDALPRLIRAKGGVSVQGFLPQREAHYFQEALDTPSRPFAMLLGGAKVSSKMSALEALLSRVDALLVGGVAANTLRKAMGLETGRSRVERSGVEVAKRLLSAASEKLSLPVDFIVRRRGSPSPRISVDSGGVTPEDEILDIGRATVEAYRRLIGHAGTILWSGPMGVFEDPLYANGTLRLADAAASAATAGATVIVGGGDSARAVRAAGVAEQMTHVSTGGGASLALVTKRPLPAFRALSERGELEKLRRGGSVGQAQRDPSERGAS